MKDTVTIVGRVAQPPVRTTTNGGVAVTNIRVASAQGYYDLTDKRWVEKDSNWYDVAVFRDLGDHAHASLKVGDPVFVRGKLSVRPWESNGKRGTAVEIDAESIGHDLRWGTTVYTKASTDKQSEHTASDESAETQQWATAAPSDGDPSEADGGPLDLDAALSDAPWSVTP